LLNVTTKVKRSDNNSSQNSDERRELEELEQLARFLVERGRISRSSEGEAQGDGDLPQDGSAPS